MQPARYRRIVIFKLCERGRHGFDQSASPTRMSKNQCPNRISSNPIECPRLNESDIELFAEAGFQPRGWRVVKILAVISNRPTSPAHAKTALGVRCKRRYHEASEPSQPHFISQRRHRANRLMIFLVDCDLEPNLLTGDPRAGQPAKPKREGEGTADCLWVRAS